MDLVALVTEKVELISLFLTRIKLEDLSLSLPGIVFILFFLLSRLAGSFSARYVPLSVQDTWYVRMFSSGYSSYAACFVKAKKQYGALFLIFSILVLWQIFMGLTYEGDISQLSLKALAFIAIFYIADILYSYVILAFSNLLQIGDTGYRFLFYRTLSITRAIIALILVDIVCAFSYRATSFYLDSALATALMVTLWLSVTTYTFPLLLIDEVSPLQAFRRSLRLFYTSTLTVIGFVFAALMHIAQPLVVFMVSFVAAIALAQQLPADYLTIFSAVSLGIYLLLLCWVTLLFIRILTTLILFTVAYWLYNRKKQTVPFDKEYIESLEG